MTDKIIVMYAGKVFEQAPTRDLFNTPANPYTRGLLKSVPDPAHEEGTELIRSRDSARCRASSSRAVRSPSDVIAPKICVVVEYPPFVR
jgi:ABC-type dipeptide/oligopeptide/nickel transport system ATPase component